MILMFDFLKSIRFWKLGIIALAQFLSHQGVIPQDLSLALTVWLGGSVAVRTIDRIGE